MFNRFSIDFRSISIDFRSIFDRFFCRPRILIESARFPPFGFDITEMSSNTNNGGALNGGAHPLWARKERGPEWGADPFGRDPEWGADLFGSEKTEGP